jgi:hypothetical protein
MSHVAESIPPHSRAERFDSLTKSSGIESNEMKCCIVLILLIDLARNSLALSPRP